MTNTIQTYSIDKTDGSNGFDFQASGDYLTINAGIHIGAKHGSGVFNQHTEVGLTNYGTIYSNDNYGVAYQGSDSDIANYGGITGVTDGVVFAGQFDRLHNEPNATIVGVTSFGVAFNGSSSLSSLDNAGDIQGRSAGVYVVAGDGGGTITNLAGGTIRSAQIGINVSSTAGAPTDIENDAGATIRGGDASIYASNHGALHVLNRGVLDGQLVCTAAGKQDSVENHGVIQGAVYLGSGSDRFDGRGGTSGAIFGEAGRDTLIGGKGGDQLHGGLATNQLTGGHGHDQFFFDTALANSFSHIADFAPGVDHIMLSHHLFGALNPAGHTLSPSLFHVGPSFSAAGQRIDYNPGNGWLTYDSNGSAAGGNHVHFATLDPHLALHSADFTVIA